jgi:hypothetical protein
MTVINKTFGKQIVSTNPPQIPRKGDKIDMGFAPAPEVKDVIWDFGTDISYDTKVTVLVD